jgi:hypothetical protein
MDIYIGSGKYANGSTALHNAILNRQEELHDYCFSRRPRLGHLRNLPILPLIDAGRLFVVVFKGYCALWSKYSTIRRSLMRNRGWLAKDSKPENDRPAKKMRRIPWLDR